MNGPRSSEKRWRSNITLKTIELSSLDSSHIDPTILIWLHGYRENETIYPEWLLSLKNLRVISVRAPLEIHNNAYAWCNVEFTPNGPIDDPCEAEESRIALLSYIEKLPASSDAPRNVYLAGFSQGATIALTAAISYPERIAGVASFCSRVIPEYLPEIHESLALRTLPILLINGTEDAILPLRHARASRYALQQLTENLVWREAPLRHEMTKYCADIFMEWMNSINGTSQRRIL
jgi:phospholipase/carboxylesterase